MSSPVARSAPKVLAGAACVALALQLTACGPGAGKTAAQSSTPAASTSSASAASASSASGTGASTTPVASGGSVVVVYYQGQPDHEAELVQMGLSAFPQVFSASQLKVQLQAIPTAGDLTTTLLNLIAQDASPSSPVVCACASMPSQVTQSSFQGYPLILQEKAPSANFYYSVGQTPSAPPDLQPFATALATIQSQAVAKGQTFVSSFLQTNFGESASRSQETYDSLAGKPVLASTGDLQVNEVDFYPMLGWGHTSEYMTQAMTITNPTENDVSGLTIPVPPGVSDLHAGSSGHAWPPFTGAPLTVSASGTVTVSSAIPALQTTQISMTYKASSDAATTWPSFTWTLPFAAQAVKVQLATYYAEQGDSVTTNLPAQPTTSAFSTWGASNMQAGNAITFRPYAPSHKPLV